MNDVHFLIRPDSAKQGLVYPTEIDAANYVAFGAFYITRTDTTLPDDKYVFKAILGDLLIRPFLVRFSQQEYFYRVEVKRVGSFIFYAEPLRNPLPYVGSQPVLIGQSAHFRMRSWKLASLDRACRQHGFYFVGSSPQNEENQG